MSNLTKEAQYALLADNVYWDVRKGYIKDKEGQKDFSESNWTPVPPGWSILTKDAKDENGNIIKDEKGKTVKESFEVYSSTQYPEKNDELKGFTARAYKKDVDSEVYFA